MRNKANWPSGGQRRVPRRSKAEDVGREPVLNLSKERPTHEELSGDHAKRTQSGGRFCKTNPIRGDAAWAGAWGTRSKRAKQSQSGVATTQGHSWAGSHAPPLGTGVRNKANPAATPGWVSTWRKNDYGELNMQKTSAKQSQFSGSGQEWARADRWPVPAPLGQSVRNKANSPPTRERIGPCEGQPAKQSQFYLRGRRSCQLCQSCETKPILEGISNVR